MERGNLSFWCKGEKLERGRVPNTKHRGGLSRSSDEGSVMEPERRGQIILFYLFDNGHLVRRNGKVK
jgi:hypothetical protein